MTIIALLLMTSIYMPVQPASAEGCYWYDLFFCDECPSEQGIEIEPLHGDELHLAVSEALQNEDVKTLRDALIADGYTPMVDGASANNVVDMETGDTKGLGVVISFRGEGIYSAIYYFHCLFEDTEYAAASIAYEFEDQVNMNVYKVTEEGEVTVIVVHGQSCTWNCVMDCCIARGLSGFTAAACISACITCATTGWPACFACGYCGGVVLRCAVDCCL